MRRRSATSKHTLWAAQMWSLNEHVSTDAFKVRKNLSVVKFIESIYEIAETCQFGPLKEELIRDPIVIGYRNAPLSQNLMQDEKLNLEKAVKEAKSSHLVKEHDELLTAVGGEISSVRGKKKK